MRHGRKKIQYWLRRGCFCRVVVITIITIIITVFYLQYRTVSNNIIGIHLDLDTCPGQSQARSLYANLHRGLGTSYKPADIRHLSQPQLTHPHRHSKWLQLHCSMHCPEAYTSIT